MCKCRTTTRLGVFPLGIALGIVSGLWMMLFAWAVYASGHGATLITQWGQIYTGYVASIQGGFYGFLWGFLDGFISGIILALIYNLLLWGCKCCCGCKLEED